MENKDTNGTIEVVIDDRECVNIPLSRYDELIRAETERNIVRHTYQTQDCYRYDDVFSAVFGPKKKDGDNDAE